MDITVIQPIAIGNLALISMVESQFDEIPELKDLRKYIIAKEISYQENEFLPNVVDLCMLFFCEHEDLKQNEKLYSAFKYLKNYYINVFGESLEDKQFKYDYDLLLSTPNFIDSDTFTYKNLFSYENREKLAQELILNWENLSNENKLSWITVLFMTLNYQLLNYLIIKLGSDEIEKLLDKLNEDDINLYFDAMLTNYASFVMYEHDTNCINHQAQIFLYFCSVTECFNNCLINKLFDENRASYLELIETHNSL